jgi:hypothetical protein
MVYFDLLNLNENILFDRYPQLAAHFAKSLESYFE